MKRSFLILFIGMFLLASGCNTMKAIEDDMSSLLKHVEVDSLSSSGSTQTKAGSPPAADPASSSATSPGKPARKAPPSENQDHSITIQVFPRESTIKVMNIKSRYYPGMRLRSGKYDILVEHEGYKSYREWVNVEYDVIVKVILKKKAEAYMSRSFDPIGRPDPAETQETAAGAAVTDNSGEPLALVESGPPSAKMQTAAENGTSTETGLPSALSGHYGTVSSICFSPDGSLLASGSYDSMVILWKTENGSMVHRMNHGDRVTAVAFSPDGRTVVSAGSDKAIKLWDAVTGELMGTLAGHTGRIHSVAFDLSGRTLVSGGNNELIIWDAADGKITNLIVGDDRLYPRFGPIKAIAFHPSGMDAEGNEFAFSCLQGIALFNPETKQLSKLDDTAAPNSVTYSPDGTHIAWGARHHHYKDDFFPRFVRADTKERDPVFTKDDELAKADRVFFTGYTPDGNHLVMLTYNLAVLYDIQAGAVIRKFSGTSETAVTDAALSPDGHILAVSAKDAIRIWKID